MAPNLLSGKKSQLFNQMPTNIVNIQIIHYKLDGIISADIQQNGQQSFNHCVNYIKHLKHLKIYSKLKAISNSYPIINYGIPSGTNFPFRNAYYNASSNYSSQFQVNASQK